MHTLQLKSSSIIKNSQEFVNLLSLTPLINNKTILINRVSQRAFSIIRKVEFHIQRHLIHQQLDKSNLYHQLNCCKNYCIYNHVLKIETVKESKE